MPFYGGQMQAYRGPGFTIVELVIIILILGIVSAFGIARVLRGDTLDSAVISDQVISMARAAQQKSIGRNDVKLRIEPVGNNLSISISDGSGILETSSVSVEGISLFGDINQQTACTESPSGVLITNSSVMELNYNSLGDLLSGGVGGVNSIETGARICLTPDVIFSICISAAGYAYRGNCLE